MGVGVGTGLAVGVGVTVGVAVTDAVGSGVLGNATSTRGAQAVEKSIAVMVIIVKAEMTMLVRFFIC